MVYTDYLDEAFVQLYEEGVCVIPDVLSDDKCNKYIDDIWTWLEGIGTGIKRDDKSTWTSENWPMNIHGIVEYPSASHENFVWSLRQHENIIDIFAKLWNDKDLLVSFDRICIMRASYGKNVKSTSWYHTDEGTSKRDISTIQGFINLEKTDKNDGALMVIAGSHKYHKQFFEEHKIECKKDWYKISEDEFKWFESKGLSTKKIVAPKGSVILWKSTLFHCNCPPTKDQEKDRFRYVVYLSYLPRKSCDKKQLEKKQQAFLNSRSTSHNSVKITLFPKLPRTYGRDISRYKVQDKLPELSDIGKRLSGF